MDSDNRDLERAQNEESGEEPISDVERPALRRLTRRSVQLHFRLPLPPPNILREYDEVAPNAAERILRMAERQAEHRNSIERGDSRRATLGIIAGVIVALATLALPAYAFYLGQPFTGLVSVGVIVGVSGFIYRTRKRGTTDPQPPPQPPAA